MYANEILNVFNNKRLNSQIYDGPSVNEKIYLNIFSPPYFVGRKYI